MSWRTILTAAFGALVGIAIITFTGLRAHIGSTFFDGPEAYLVSGLAGAACALVIRYGIRETFGI